MENKKYYDPLRKRLIFIRSQANASFWDKQWQVDEKILGQLRNISSTRFTQVTQKYLKPTDGKILEGGCGRGEQVASLVKAGYKTVGVDFASQTVKSLNQFVPELDIRLADVKKLPFENNYFIGYWSLGVIEHFWQGFDEILSEANRVLKKDGYFFLTFPYMSPLRQLKAALGFYSKYTADQEPANFYQFALDKVLVIEIIKKNGFDLIEQNPFDAQGGLQEELAISNKLLERILSKIFLSISHHAVLLVFRKK